jgi:hypothetical protein
MVLGIRLFWDPEIESDNYILINMYNSHDAEMVQKGTEISQARTTV